MTKFTDRKVAVITGTAGFIGYHVATQLLQGGWTVIGIDSISDYYDVGLKKSREEILSQHPKYRSIHEKIEKPDVCGDVFAAYKPDIVVHLAAQAGVRYSIENPRSYLESNIVGTYELLEAARNFPPSHMLLASTSSAYGASNEMPFKETVKADHQMSFYAATKKSTENFAHSYSHLYDLPITIFRFFTVYGPWGRPDMALFKFTQAILDDREIDVYNYGNMTRDFTYVEDLATSVTKLIDVIPDVSKKTISCDSLSPVAPYRVVNIGNSKPTELIEFISQIEISLGRRAKKNFLPMQPGDVPMTAACNDLLFELTGYKPDTDVKSGVSKFINWYVNYYGRGNN